jgi:hypothetical protein
MLLKLSTFDLNMNIDPLAGYAAVASTVGIAYQVYQNRKESLKSLMPKPDVKFISKAYDNFIDCKLNITNNGDETIFLKGVQINAYNSDYDNDNILFGTAVYGTDLIIHEGRILNKLFGLDTEFDYNTFGHSLNQVLQIHEKNKESNTNINAFTSFPEERFEGLERFVNDAENSGSAVLARSYFLIPEYVDKVCKNSRITPDMRETVLPEEYEIIGFGKGKYESKINKVRSSRGDRAYRIRWKQNPCWGLNHTVLTLMPEELGVPGEIDSRSSRDVIFTIPTSEKGSYDLEAILFLSKPKITWYLGKKEGTDEQPYYTKEIINPGTHGSERWGTGEGVF